MTIKKIISAIICVCAVLAAVGCSEPKPLEVDCAALADELLEKVQFEDVLTQIGANIVPYFYGTDNFVSAYVYCGSGATAEEVAVFEAADDEAGEALYSAVQTHIKDQITTFGGYIPTEVARLENAVIAHNGKYIAVCVTADADTAKEIIGKALGVKF